jgi:RHS repeat-associated protein
MTTGPDGSGAWVLWDKLDVAEQHEFHPGAAERVTIFTRDANRKVTDVEQPSGKHVGYVQGNCCGSIDTLVDSAGNQTHWQYDVLGRVAAKWLRWGQPGEVQVQTFGYDAVGRPTAIQDARGNAKTFGYDAEGRLSAIQYAVNAANTRPTSDVALSYEPVYGRLATVSDGTGVTSYGYVPFNAADGVFGDGALATESKSVGAGVQFTHSYSYDALGRTLTGPRQTSAQWDALGRLTGAASGLGAFTFGYQGTSGRLATVDAALTDATVAFNTGFIYQSAAQGRRLTDIVHQVGFAPADWRVLSQHHFGYDALGRLSTWQKSWRDWATAMQTGTWALTHDTDDQLTGIAETDAAATPTGSFAYGYDLAGNRTTSDRTTPAAGTVNRQWTPNGLNQLTAQSAGPEAGAYTHDLDGNLLADNTRTYQWDAENRLVGVTGPFGTVTWEYDAFSRRVKQHDTAPAGPEIVRDLIWEGLSIIESRNQATGEIRRYYGNGEERQLAAAVTRLHYSTDHLGSIRELTDATGTIRARYDYDPYGNVTKLSGNLDTDFAYTGHYYHAASGLHLAPYRGYNPRLGRWLSRDPIEEEGGLNLYGYVLNDPVNVLDPLGLAGVNLFPTSDSIYAKAEALPCVIRGYFTVAGHGSQLGMVGVDLKTLEEKIRKAPGYKEGMPVVLMGCHVGAGKQPEQLAKLLKAKVAASDQFVWWDWANAQKTLSSATTGTGYFNSTTNRWVRTSNETRWIVKP